MFLRSIKEINKLINNGMTHIYLSSSYWEKLTFSKSWFSKFKFLIFSAISIHHKWIENRLLSLKGECTSWLRSFQTTEDLGSWKIRKFQENPWKAWNWWQVISWPSKSQTSIVVLRNSQKSAVLLIVWENICQFLTRHKTNRF